MNWHFYILYEFLDCSWTVREVLSIYYSVWIFNPAALHEHTKHCFLFFKLVTTVLSAESRWKMKLRTSKDGPWRPYTLTPHPELEHWLGKGTRSPPYACWGGFNTHNPSSHLPLPSCSGWCPNASTSHLGLPKPVLTVVVGGYGEHSPLTVTLWSKDWLRFR